MNCKYCEKKCKNNLSRAAHQNHCKNNPDKLDYTGKNNPSYGIKRENQYTKAKRLGLPKPKMSEESRKKISVGAIKAAKKYWSDPNNKKRQSEIMKEAVLKYPDSYSASNVSGRAKITEYNGIKLKGSWELETAKYLDRENIKWTNSIEPIPYEWNDNWHLYFPDFYLSDYDIYLEVKGYERERDRCKWKSIDNLIIIKLKEINEIKDNDYDIFKFLPGPN